MAKGTLVRATLESCLPETLEHVLQVAEVLLEASSWDHNIIEIDYTTPPLQISVHSIH